MGMDYKIYENWYKYMSSVYNQIQGFSAVSGRSGLGRTSSAGLDTSDTFLDALLRINALRNQETEASPEISSEEVQTVSSEQSMDAIFAEAARTYGVPLNLLKAMGKAESGFNPNAVSPAGAQGVMQLMPATAKSLGVEDPFDARSNIMGGAKYISEKLNQYNGNIDLALAAYNAGSGNVAKYGGVPPFAETRNYIARIKGYMNSDLTIDKTVNVKTTVSNAQTSQLSGQNTQTSRLTGQNAGAGSKTAYKMSQTDAQYFVDLMQLQMLSRASTLSSLNWSFDSSDERDSYIL